MAFNLTNEDLERLQQLQRLHQTQQLQQAAALHQTQDNGPAANRTARSTQGRRHRRRQRQPVADPAAEQMITDVGPANRRNRRAFKTWYRDHKHTMRLALAQDSVRMSADVARYGVSRPEWFIKMSSGEDLRDLLQGLSGAQKLALFHLAMGRQEEDGDIASDKVAVFNTINGRPGDMPLGSV